MLTTRPPLPPAIINGRANLQHRKVPVALISIVRRQASSAICTTGAGSTTAPALFTNMSRRPNTREISATIACTEAASVTSTRTARACTPNDSISPATARSSSHRPLPAWGKSEGGAQRSPTITWAPSRASRLATASPIPPFRPAPVTTATRPFRSYMIRHSSR